MIDVHDGAKSLGERLKALREQKQLTQAAVAATVGVAISTVSRWGRNGHSLGFDDAVKLASLYGVGVSELTGDDSTESPMGGGQGIMRRVKLVGQLQAGSWREAIEFPPEEQGELPIYLAPHQRHLVAQAFRVCGQSMNKLYPHETIVIVAATIANKIQPRSGQVVLVQRRNKRGQIEATLKEYVVGPDGVKWLWPRSTDPQYQTPLAYKEGDEDVVITGIVIRAHINEEDRVGK